MTDSTPSARFQKIGIFDSGVGGLTVLAALRKRFPELDYVYFGDTANLPYGTKSPAQIAKLSRESARLLMREQVDGVVIACNTASALGMEAVREELGGLPVLGVVEPGVDAVLRAKETLPSTAPVLILATRATVKSGAYLRGLKARGVQDVFEQACPLLVPLIEEDWTQHPVLDLTLEEYVRPVRDLGVPGVALLGCTHYPWILESFERALPGWTVVNSASAVAEAVSLQILAPQTARSARRGAVRWLFSDPDAVPSFASRWIEAESR